MKSLVAVVLAVASQSVAATFSFESLVANSAKHIAPTAIQRAMAQFEKERLLELAEVDPAGRSTLTTFFAAVPIDLGDKARTTYLVFPSRYSKAFFGAHAISYWLLEKRADGSFELLFSGSCDQIEILKQRTHGLHDVRSFYSDMVGHVRFNGRAYEAKEPF